MTYDVLDLFAGIGGWGVALDKMGLTHLGIENDPIVCQTRDLVGHPTRLHDLSNLTVTMNSTEGLVASPPCQDWSRLAKGDITSARGKLVWATEAWIERLLPGWVCMEQVVPALKAWEKIAVNLREWGYHTWTGVVNAADYGTPQARRRAVLLARLSSPITLTEPTHSKHLGSWVSVMEGLNEIHDWHNNGWYPPKDWIRDRRNDQSQCGEVDPHWVFFRPATTIAGRPLLTDPGTNANRFNGRKKSRNDGFHITLEEALVLQGFRPDFQVHGNKRQQFRQVGNAIPPQLAEALIKSVLF
jgi:DNA (cytosine-5)-methyltransferase 1